MMTHVKKICPHCSFHNELDVDVCMECGLSLKGDKVRYTTLVNGTGVPVLSGSTVNLEDAFVPENLDAVPEGALALYFDGFTEPLLVREAGCTLGRITGSGLDPNVDLTPYKAYALGVSRVHAYLERTPEGYSVQDLGSANHTFVNGLKVPGQELYPLRPGDRLKLANLTAFVFFVPKTSVTFTLQVKQDYFSAITPAVLSKHLVPYIEGITIIQRQLNQLQQNNAADVKFKSLAVLPGNTLKVRVQLEHVNDAIAMIRKVYHQWAHATLNPPIKGLAEQWLHETYPATRGQSIAIDETIQALQDMIASPFTMLAGGD